MEIGQVLSDNTVAERGNSSELMGMMRMEMGWMSRLWSFLGKNYKELSQKYLDRIDEVLAIFHQTQTRPQISRNSKRQCNMRKK